MATKVVVCPECESPLVPGRFSCSGCGTLLASVASVSRSFAVPAPVAPPTIDREVPAPDPEPGSVNGHDPAEDVERDDDAPLASAAVSAEIVEEPVAATPAPVLQPEPAPAPEPQPLLEPDPALVPDVLPIAAVDAPATVDGAELHWQVAPEPAVRAELATAALAATGGATPAWPAQPAWPEQPAWPQQPAWPAQPAWPPAPEVPAPAAAEMAPAEPAPRPLAGAYLPPSAVLPPGEALPVNGKATGATLGDPTQKRSLAERFALGEEDGPLGLPVEMPGRTIALGSAIAALGFLLPWAEIVIGSASIGSFLDQWGLAAPGSALLLLALIVVSALAVLRERTGVKVGTSTAAIILGALLVGVAFPYLMGPFQEAVGVYVTLAGALILIAGGLLARAAPRHDPEDAAV